MVCMYVRVYVCYVSCVCILCVYGCVYVGNVPYGRTYVICVSMSFVRKAFVRYDMYVCMFMYGCASCDICMNCVYVFMYFIYVCIYGVVCM